MKCLIPCVLLLLLLQNSTQAQSRNARLSEPKPGKPCPGFRFDKIDFYKNKTVSLADLKGKWVILDFWSRYCTACVASLPKISRKQAHFGDKVQFIMVAPDSTDVERKMFTAFHQKLNLAMPSAFDDALFRSFSVGLLPYMIIIDPKGIVRAITSNADSAQLSALLAGENPMFTEASYSDGRERVEKFDRDQALPYLTFGNGGKDTSFLFRSLLSKWVRNRSPWPSESNRSVMKEEVRDPRPPGRFELFGCSIEDLYRTAYSGRVKFKTSDTGLYGKLCSQVVFEIGNKDVLRINKISGENMFSYSLVVPAERASEKVMTSVMQNDLKNYFGYEVKIEIRKMPYWKLVATSSAREKLRTKGGKTFLNRTVDHTKRTLQNVSMSILLKVVEGDSEVTLDGTPLLDETDITSNIDIILENYVDHDLNLTKQALQSNGLDLIKGEKEMKVIVVRDPMMH